MIKLREVLNEAKKTATAPNSDMAMTHLSELSLFGKPELHGAKHLTQPGHYIAKSAGSKHYQIHSGPYKSHGDADSHIARTMDLNRKDHHVVFHNGEKWRMSHGDGLGKKMTQEE